jgi:hypothetical protein
MNEAQIEHMLDRIWEKIPVDVLTEALAEQVMAEITEIVYDAWTGQENEGEAEADEPVRNEGWD